MNKAKLIEHAKSRVGKDLSVSYGDIGEPVIGALILRLVEALEDQAEGTTIYHWDYQYFYYGNMEAVCVRRSLTDPDDIWVETKEWGKRWEQITVGEYEKYRTGAWPGYLENAPLFSIPEIFLHYYAKAYDDERNGKLEVELIPLDTSSK